MSAIHAKRTSAPLGTVGAAAAAIALAACALPGAAGGQPLPPPPPGAGGGELARPRVAVPSPSRPRYQRDQWQPHGWADADANGCNTRAEVLLSEAVGPVSRSGGCRITAGEWEDRYTGRRVTNPAQLQIDHLVSLGDASASGGWAWRPERKLAFANDLDDADELNAVWGPENERKADQGPDGWLPPNRAFRCSFVAAYSRIKARWDLTVTPAQWAAIEAVWSGCRGNQP